MRYEQPTALQRVLATNSTATAYQLAQDVVRKPAESATIVRVPVGQSLGAIVVFTGTAADGAKGTCKVYGEYELKRSPGSDNPSAPPGQAGGNPGEVVRFLFGTATLLLGANQGPTGGLAIASTDYIVDTITWVTTSTFLATCETAFTEGTSAAFSPGDDTVAALILPCLARCTSLVFDFNNDSDGTDTTGLNAHVAFFPI